MANDGITVKERVEGVIKRDLPHKEIASVTQNAVGIAHLNFEIAFTDGSKVFYRGHNPKGAVADGRDIYFGDPGSLDRQEAVMGCLGRTNVPVPEVLSSGEGPLGKYLLVSYLPGVHLRQYLEETGHRPYVLLDSLMKIGRTLASTKQVTFGEFGSIQKERILGARTNWADRLFDILARHEVNPQVYPRFTKREWDSLQSFIGERLAEVRICCAGAIPQIVIGDLHIRNFYVYPRAYPYPERAGSLSGVFDVELAQAAHPTLEWGFMTVGIFPIYGEKWFDGAKAAFLEGYAEGGGDCREFSVLTDLYLMNHALSAVGFYSGMKDGIRNNWSDAFKTWALDIARNRCDPGMVVELTRPLHKVPRLD